MSLIPNHSVILILFLFMLSRNTHAQAVTILHENSNTIFTLEDCIRYALKNQPALRQSAIDESIAKADNGIALSSWLPQVSGTANLQHYFQLPTAFSNTSTGPVAVSSGVYNYSIPQITATQTIFGTDALLAVKASKLNNLQARQNTTNVKIALVAAVTKAFYDLLLSFEQISVYGEDTARLHKNKLDAYNRYVAGISDKVDYKQASISLNNSLSQLKTANENEQSKYAVLKQLMGMRSDDVLNVAWDSARMMQEVYIDTSATLRFEKRIEYQQLQTIKRIQHETTKYYQMGFLPSLSLFYNYCHEFEDNKFSDLYGRAYPYSLAGLQLNIPIFSGFKRTENIHKAKLLEQRTDWDEVYLKLAIFTEYRQALSNYKSNLYYMHTQSENAAMAREVFNIVKLQYREGIKPYIDVIVAESDLQSSEINYLNALFHLLESKTDLEKAMGDIPTDF